MTVHKYRSTDATDKPPVTVITDAESARRAALTSITAHCGFCSFSTTSQDPKMYLEHKCTDSAGRDLSEVKKRHNEGHRRAAQALKNFTPPPCSICGKSYPPGSSHNCGYPTAQLPHDVAVTAFQKKGMAQLAQDLKEVQ